MEKSLGRARCALDWAAPPRTCPDKTPTAVLEEHAEELRQGPHRVLSAARRTTSSTAEIVEVMDSQPGVDPFTRVTTSGAAWVVCQLLSFRHGREESGVHAERDRLLLVG